MYNTSTEWKEKIYEDVQSIMNVYFDDILVNSDYVLDIRKGGNVFIEEFSLGNTPSQYVEMKVYKNELTIPKKIRIEYGILTNEDFEIIPLGIFNVDDYTDNDDGTLTIKALDNMIKFEVNYDGSTLEYPRNLMTVLTDICNKVGVELGSTSFLNADKEVAVYDNTVSARTYLSYIAEQAGGFAFIGRDGKLYIKTIGEDVAELPVQYFQDFKWGEQFKVSRIRYEDGVQLFEAGDETNNTIYINQENMYIVDQEQIDNIHDKYKDFNCYSFEGNSIIDPALDIGDLLLIDGKYVIYQGDMEYVGKFKANISSKIQAKTKEETMARVPSAKTEIRRVQSQINQAEALISSLVEVTSSLNEGIDILDADLQKQIQDLSLNLQDYQATVSTQWEQTNTSFEMQFKTLIESINNNAKETNAKFEEQVKYIRFVNGSIVLGKEGNKLILQIQNDRISYQQNGSEVAYFSDNQLFVTKIRVTEELDVATLSIVVEENRSVSIEMGGVE